MSVNIPSKSARLAALFLSASLISCSDSSAPADSATKAKAPSSTATPSETIDGPFTFGSQDNVLVQWNNQPLIENERINYIEKTNLADGAESSFSVSGEFQVKNISAPDAKTPYRRELGISPSEVELTTEFNLPVYTNEPDKTSIIYQFAVPLKTLGEATFTALIGRTHSPKTIEGKIFPDMSTNELLKTYGLNSARWITFHTKQGDLSFDLNPKGVTAYSDFGPGDLIGQWAMRIRDNSLILSFSGKGTLYGGIYAAKLRVFTGGIEEFKNRHFHEKYRYFSETPVSARYLFGGQPRNKLDTIIKPSDTSTDA
ncbi:MAG: hypothetical protein ACK5LK_07240 [Chthoniobacterales bacterium]